MLIIGNKCLCYKYEINLLWQKIQSSYHWAVFYGASCSCHSLGTLPGVSWPRQASLVYYSRDIRTSITMVTDWPITASARLCMNACVWMCPSEADTASQPGITPRQEVRILSVTAVMGWNEMLVCWLQVWNPLGFSKVCGGNTVAANEKLRSTDAQNNHPHLFSPVCHTLVDPSHSLLWLFSCSPPSWLPLYIILWVCQLSALSSLSLLPLCGLDSSQIDIVVPSHITLLPLLWIEQRHWDQRRMDAVLSRPWLKSLSLLFLWWIPLIGNPARVIKVPKQTNQVFISDLSEEHERHVRCGQFPSFALGQLWSSHVGEFLCAKSYSPIV